MTINVIRHGDLLLNIDGGKESKPTQKKEDNCILDGEVTGHHHRLGDTAVVEVAIEEPSQSNDYYRGYIEIKEKEEVLTHEEHDTIVLQPGKYDARTQREYDPIEERRVRD